MVEHAGQSSLRSESEPPLDALVVLGKNWEEKPPKRILKNLIGSMGEAIAVFKPDLMLVERMSRFAGEESQEFTARLSLDSKISALAAGRMFDGGKVGHLIFSTGRTLGIEHPSEAEEMAKYVKARIPSIPEEAVTIEGRSFDTTSNIAESEKIIEEKGYKKVAYATVEHHVPRTQTLLSQSGYTDREVISTYDELSNRSRSHRRFINRHRHSVRHIKDVIFETALLGLTAFIDPRGEKMATVTRKVRRQDSL